MSRERTQGRPEVPAPAAPPSSASAITPPARQASGAGAPRAGSGRRACPARPRTGSRPRPAGGRTSRRRSVTSPWPGLVIVMSAAAVVDGQDRRGVVVGAAAGCGCWRSAGRRTGPWPAPSAPNRTDSRGGHAVTSRPPGSGTRSGRPASRVEQRFGLGGQRVRDRRVGQRGQAPVAALDRHRVGPRLGGELAGEVDVPGLQVLGQREGDQQRRAAGGDVEQRRPVLGSGRNDTPVPGPTGSASAGTRRAGPSGRVLVLRRRAAEPPRREPGPRWP